SIQLARTNVNAAMDFMRHAMPIEFLIQHEKHIYLREQEDRMNRINIIISNEYKWPESSPNYTSALREVVNHWANKEFNRTSRATCLILIGPPGTGKTSFAKSLLGYYTYFNGQWRLDLWKNFAHYSIFDNIGWDQFDENGYPKKKQILT
ncbi:unnamed protein product, partial [Rotaria sordida]